MASKVLLFMVEALGAMTEDGAVGIGAARERKVQWRKKEETKRRECHPDTTTTTAYPSLSLSAFRLFSFTSFPGTPPFRISVLAHSFLSFFPFSIFFLYDASSSFVKEVISVPSSTPLATLSTPVSGPANRCSSLLLVIVLRRDHLCSCKSIVSDDLAKSRNYRFFYVCPRSSSFVAWYFSRRLPFTDFNRKSSFPVAASSSPASSLPFVSNGRDTQSKQICVSRW